MAIFAEVVKTGSFRKAAKSLSLSPSVVSYHISQLEHKMGAALIYRSTRKLSLSHDGEAFYSHVLNMMNAANQGIELLSSAQMEARGKIKVSLPTALSRSFINDKIAKFAIKYPEIALNVDYSDTQNNIIGEKVDLTIRAGELEDSDFISKKLGVLKRQLVCTSPFYLKHPHPVLPQNVSTWQWIKLTQLSNQRLFSKSGQRQAVRFNNQISVNSVEAIYQYCLNGVGLATLSSSQVSEDILTGRLVHVLPDWEITPLPLFALWPKNTKPKSIVKLFLSYLTQ